jgi:hypothetical protein
VGAHANRSIEAAGIHRLSRLVAWPLAARAQQQVMPVDGLLSGNRFDERELAAIRKGRAQVLEISPPRADTPPHTN